MIIKLFNLFSKELFFLNETTFLKIWKFIQKLLAFAGIIFFWEKNLKKAPRWQIETRIYQ